MTTSLISLQLIASSSQSLLFSDLPHKEKVPFYIFYPFSHFLPSCMPLNVLLLISYLTISMS